MQRYSIKRQAILDCLRATSSHPTAEWIYLRLKPSFPNLSLATVYRNLTQLKRFGLVRSMGTVLGQEHFDANMEPHSHVVCTCCGKIVDVTEISFPDEIVAHIHQLTGYVVSGKDIQFSGICAACQKEKETI